MGFSVAKVPPFIQHYTFQKYEDENCIVLPRGALERVAEFLKKENLSFRWEDRRVSRKSIDVSITNVTLEPQQLQLIDILLQNEGGLIEMDPGGGKTLMCLGLIDRIKQPTLIIVHEHRLRSQWEHEIKQRLQGNFTLGRYDGDKHIDGDIVIAIVNSAYNLHKEDSSFFAKFGLGIVTGKQP